MAEYIYREAEVSGSSGSEDSLSEESNSETEEEEIDEDIGLYNIPEVSRTVFASTRFFLNKEKEIVGEAKIDVKFVQESTGMNFPEYKLKIGDKTFPLTSFAKKENSEKTVVFRSGEQISILKFKDIEFIRLLDYYKGFNFQLYNKKPRKQQVVSESESSSTDSETEDEIDKKIKDIEGESEPDTDEEDEKAEEEDEKAEEEDEKAEEEKVEEEPKVRPFRFRKQYEVREEIIKQNSLDYNEYLESIDTESSSAIEIKKKIGNIIKNEKNLIMSSETRAQIVQGIFNKFFYRLKLTKDMEEKVKNVMDQSPILFNLLKDKKQ